MGPEDKAELVVMLALPTLPMMKASAGIIGGCTGKSSVCRSAMRAGFCASLRLTVVISNHRRRRRASRCSQYRINRQNVPLGQNVPLDKTNKKPGQNE